MNDQSSSGSKEEIFELISRYVDDCLMIRDMIRRGFAMIFFALIVSGTILLLINNLFNINLSSLTWLLIKFYGLALISIGILLIYVFWYREKIIAVRTINLISLATALSGFKGVLSPKGISGRNIPTLIKIVKMVSLALMLTSILNLAIMIVLAILSSKTNIIVHYNSIYTALSIILVAPVIIYTVIIKTVNIKLKNLSSLLKKFSVRIKFENTSKNYGDWESRVEDLDEYVYKVMRNLFNIVYIPQKVGGKESVDVKDTYIRVFSQAMAMRIPVLAPYIASILEKTEYRDEKTRKEKIEKIIDTITFMISLSEVLKIHLDLNEIYHKVIGKHMEDKKVEQEYTFFTIEFLDKVQELSGTRHIILPEANTLKLLGTQNQLKIEIIAKTSSDKTMKTNLSNIKV